MCFLRPTSLLCRQDVADSFSIIWILFPKAYLHMEMMITISLGAENDIFSLCIHKIYGLLELRETLNIMSFSYAQTLMIKKNLAWWWRSTILGISPGVLTCGHGPRNLHFTSCLDDSVVDERNVLWEALIQFRRLSWGQKGDVMDLTWLRAPGLQAQFCCLLFQLWPLTPHQCLPWTNSIRVPCNLTRKADS